MNNFLIGLSLKDWLILLALIVLLFSILKIRRLKKTITEDVLTRLMPEVSLLIEGGMDKEFYLKNHSMTIAKNIRIEEANIDIDDFGFKIPLKVIFSRVDSLNPLDQVKLDYQIFCRGNEIMPEEKSKFLMHILFTDFDCRVNYENIENKTFCSYIVNRKGKFSIREISQQKPKDA